MNLWKHQQEAYEFLRNKGSGMLAMDMGCIDGDAIVSVNRAGNTRKLPLGEVYRRFHSTWRSDIPTMLRSLCGGAFHLNQMVDIHSMGDKPVVRVELETGEVLRLTRDHEVHSPQHGWVAAETLSQGDLVTCNGTPVCTSCGSEDRVITYRYAKFRGYCQTCARKIWLGPATKASVIDKDGYVRLYRMEWHPRANKAGQVYEHIIVAERMLGRPLRDDEYVHHINGNRADNREENIKIVSWAEHNRAHNVYRHLHGGHTINGGTVTFIPRAGVVKSVRDDGTADVYDVVMADPHRNFVANGIVVHNCGKSCTAITLLSAWQCRRVLILCPKSVVSVWPDQFAKHADSDWHVLPLDTGTIPQRTAQMVEAVKAIRDKPLAVVLNYDACAYSISGPLKLIRWDALILDESHKIKAPAGKVSRFVGQLATKIPHRLALTGTPMPHSPLDIYAQFRAICPGIYPRTNTAFKAMYAVNGGYQNHQVVGYQNLDDLHERMYRATYRCRTEDVLDLPPYTDVERHCELEIATWRAYKELRDEMITEIEQGIITADNALVKLLRLAQIANGFVHTDDGRTVQLGDEKATLLGEVLEELRAGYGEQQEPVVVFARFHQDLDAIHTAARSVGLSTSELSGRRNDLNHWSNQGSDVLVVQEQSGGVGIDLTRARYCVYYSQAWSLGNYEQSRARVHRPGQTRPVTYIHLVARHTVDEAIRKALERKAEVVRHVVDDLRGIGSGHKQRAKVA